ncbi:hypothetical protein Ancab_024893 [Ancistrocladus abbreviatus]
MEMFWDSTSVEQNSLDGLSVSSSIAIGKEKVEETPAKPLANDEEEQVFKLDNVERKHISKNIYEDGKESSPSMMNSPWAGKTTVHEVSRENEDGTNWEFTTYYGCWKFNSKDGTGGPSSSYENGCQKKDPRISLSAKEAAYHHQPIESVEGYGPELEHNQGPRIDGGSVNDSGIENMNRIFLARQHPLTAKEIWEGGKMLGATPVSEKAEIVARITAMEE